MFIKNPMRYNRNPFLIVDPFTKKGVVLVMQSTYIPLININTTVSTPIAKLLKIDIGPVDSHINRPIVPELFMAIGAKFRY